VRNGSCCSAAIRVRTGASHPRDARRNIRSTAPTDALVIGRGRVLRLPLFTRVFFAATLLVAICVEGTFSRSLRSLCALIS
jgi:hypothetical protein